MARSLLGTHTPSTLATLSARPAASTVVLSDAALQQRLRQKRSAAYIEAVTQLDTGGHTHSPAATQALIDAIRQELPDVSVDALPFGIVSRCYLGAPFEVHTLNCAGNIVQHFKTSESLPQGLERARKLALHPGYAFIEVYGSRLIAVGHNGQTAQIDA